MLDSHGSLKPDNLADIYKISENLKTCAYGFGKSRITENSLIFKILGVKHPNMVPTKKNHLLSPVA